LILINRSFRFALQASLAIELLTPAISRAADTKKVLPPRRADTVFTPYRERCFLPTIAQMRAGGQHSRNDLLKLYHCQLWLLSPSGARIRMLFE
jgi:hypothetical protein